MKVSLNWLKQYLNLDGLSPEKVGEILTDIGLEVESIERTESIKGGLAGVVVGHVVEREKHPNADKLSVTKVDIGTGSLLNIVCGAPNVAAGQKVLVATVGTTLYPSEGDPITLKKGKIRGEDSEGMICAEDELGLGHDHAGIMVLPSDTPVGQSAKDYFNLEEDHLIEIGLTPNRSDATNHLGVARDLAAALKINYGHDGEVCVPEVSNFKVDNHSLPIEVSVENTEACPRYSGVVIKGIKVGESPDWLKRRLQAVDVRSINNLVDVTNFVLHELGQPLHAFDLDEITGRKVIVKTLPAGSKFLSLDEVERSLNAEDLMICDGDSNGMCIGGVFGGFKSGVKDSTANIFLEAAHFSPTYIRRSSMRHNLRTDAAKVFEKGSDPNVTVFALKRAALLIQELAGGEIASEIIDIYPTPVAPKQIKVTYAYVNMLLGVQLSPAEVQGILTAQGMSIVETDELAFTVAVPTNKVEVTRPADIAEEILRIYGFNRVEISDKFSISAGLAPQPDPSVVRNAIGDFLAAAGFNEIMAVSLSQSRYYSQAFKSISDEELVYINNTSNVQLDIMRPDMLISGLEAIVHNQNRQQMRLRLFEFGKVYRMKEGKINEKAQLSLYLTGDRYGKSWLMKSPFEGESNKTPYFTLKGYVQNVLARLGYEGYQETVLESDERFAYGVQYHRGPQTLVTFGRVSGGIAKELGVRNEVYTAVFEWDTLLKILRKQNVTYQEVSKFPSTSRDLALIIENSVKFNDIAAIARKVGKKLIKDITLFDVYENEQQLGAGKRSYAVSYLFEDAEKTLEDKEVDKVMNQLIGEYETKLGALIRR
ncbi:phenylalanine--tRNA ligase subunit beta [Haliscomenobacter sp.]|uniref:phenylalanine--tRNA ligase subunit beta n=1 Tax=Haliscomenobacter sp. TaxID=2717303 RepID=UPI0033650209